MVTDINNDGGPRRRYKNNFVSSGLRVVGNGGAHRERASIREAKERMKRESAKASERASERGGRRAILFSDVGMRGRGPHTVPLALDVFVNVNTSSADRHVNVTVDHARTEKKGRTGKREKIRLGINADLTLDDCPPSIVLAAMIRGNRALFLPGGLIKAERWPCISIVVGFRRFRDANVFKLTMNN